MVLDELLERAVMITKQIWQKQGNKITQREVKRMVAVDAPPKSEKKNAS